MSSCKLFIVAVLFAFLSLFASTKGAPVSHARLSEIVNILDTATVKLNKRSSGMSKDESLCQNVEKLVEILNTLNKTLGEAYPRDCGDAFKNGCNMSGIYWVRPDQELPFQVYCDMDIPRMRGWTVFQRRQDGTEDFDLPWENYAEGFGDLEGEFWLGLEKIYRLTSSASNTELLINMKDLAYESNYVYYGSFSLGSVHTNYSLTLGGYAGNSSDPCNNQCIDVPFMTYDRHDNQTEPVNCAEEQSGGWWFKEENGDSCGLSNLNALSPNTTLTDCKQDSGYTKGSVIHWLHVLGGCNAVRTSSEMKIDISHQ